MDLGGGGSSFCAGTAGCVFCGKESPVEAHEGGAAEKQLDILSEKLYTFSDKNEVINMAQSIENRVFDRICSKNSGWVFTPSHFLDIGNRTGIDQSLGRLAKSGKIRRLARGLYDYPEKHSALGDLPPNYERIAQALAGRDSLKIQPSGAYAANLLGLTEQVPAKVVFLTDGPNRTVQINKQQIVLKRTTPKNMATSGRISGLVIQALRHLGQDHVDDHIIEMLNKRLSAHDKQQLIKDLRFAPVWIGNIFRQLQE